jgi:hypothetical protein
MLQYNPRIISVTVLQDLTVVFNIGHILEYGYTIEISRDFVRRYVAINNFRN